jgi:hypothetical protein
MLNHDIKKASMRVASALHLEAALFLATTEEFLWATLGHLTIFSSWLLNSNQESIDGPSTNREASMTIFSNPVATSC